MAGSGGALVAEVVASLRAQGIDLAALGIAWARVMPTVTLVPAFGLGAVPTPLRFVLGLSLAACIAPAVRPVLVSAPWPLLLVAEILRGLPIAIAAAVPLYAAGMAGALGDQLRGAQDQTQAPILEGKTSPLGVLFVLLASSLFLSLGGASRVALLLVEELPRHPLLFVARSLASGIGVAVTIAAPLVATSVVLEVAGALITRASSPAQVQALLAAPRGLALLAFLGLVFDRVAVVLARVVRV